MLEFLVIIECNLATANCRGVKAPWAVLTNLGLIMIETRQRSKIDWHGDRGLSLLQLGIRTVKSLSHQARSIPFLTPLPFVKILPACGSLKKRAKLDRRIEFSKVISFSY
jgi:hypothetical protein